MEQQLRQITQSEFENVQRVLSNVQAELITQIEEDRDADLGDKIKRVLKVMKIFLGRSIHFGHMIGYSNLRCDQNLTIYLNLKYKRDTAPVMFKIELQPRQYRDFPPMI